jgi:hypothetical protein
MCVLLFCSGSLYAELVSTAPSLQSHAAYTRTRMHIRNRLAVTAEPVLTRTV